MDGSAQPVTVIFPSPPPPPPRLFALPPCKLCIYLFSCRSACHQTSTKYFFKCVFSADAEGLRSTPGRELQAAARPQQQGSGGGDPAAPGAPRARAAPAPPLRPSPGLPPQEGLDGQRDAAAAVLLLALGALPLHHDGGSGESYRRSRRGLPAGRRRRLLPRLSPALIPAFPEAEPALSALLPRPPLLPRSLPARGTWPREEGRAGGAAERGGGRSQELSAPPPPRPPLAFSTSHCGQRPAPAARRERGAGDGRRPERHTLRLAHCSPRSLFGPQDSASSCPSCTLAVPLSSFPTSAPEELSRFGEEELWGTAKQSLTVASFTPLARRSGVHPWGLAEGAHGNY